MIRRQFTPGPWLVRHGREVFSIELPHPTGVVPTIVAYVLSSDEGTPKEQDTNVSNAYLIAAAPEMLDALIGVLNPTGHTDVCTERRAFGETKCSKCCARVRAAIEKATGDAL